MILKMSTISYNSKFNYYLNITITLNNRDDSIYNKTFATNTSESNDAENDSSCYTAVFRYQEDAYDNLKYNM